MTQPLVILGTGGNCFDIADAVAAINAVRPQYKVLGFLDDDLTKEHIHYMGVKVIGTLADAASILHKDERCLFVNGIGSPGCFARKDEIISKTQIPTNRFATVVHPSAVVSPSAHIGLGSVLLANTVVCANVTIGNHVMVLPGCTINHDGRVGDYAILATNVVMCGAVTVESKAYVGAGSMLCGQTTIHSESLVGAGSVVLKDVSARTVVFGNPAQFKRNL